MNQNEIRLGNWVTDAQNKKPYQVTYEIFSEICNGMDFYESILLTEEWLKKFGFEKHPEIGWNIYNKVLHKRISIPFDHDNEARIIMPYYNGVMTIAKGIKYVHQLQNLYYTLTGTELEIK